MFARSTTLWKFQRFAQRLKEDLESATRSQAACNMPLIGWPLHCAFPPGSWLSAPLWLDETISFFLIRGGFAGMMSRQVWPDAPAYSCLLWLWTRALGTAEMTLRISSILPMAGAVYLLYCSARRLFERDLALIATIIFCLHPIVVFASFDVRPYAFAALAINLSVFALVCLRDNDSAW